MLTFLAFAAYIAVWIIALGFVARRFLSVSAGPLRLLLSGAAGLTVSVLAVGRVIQTTDGAQWAFIVLWIGIGVLTAMALLALSELVMPPGGIPRPAQWFRAWRRWRARTRRYSQISRIAVRHGLAGYMARRRHPGPAQRAGLARRLGQALEEAGAAFVKLGQALSTRHDLLPPEFTAELSRLHNQVAPAPWPGIEAVLRDELSRPAGEVFAWIDPAPLAAASIGQVHQARLRCGASVVVKVQRPGIGPVVENDLDITLRIARTLQRRARWARTIGVTDLADGFATALREELDFRIEARNMASVRAARRDDNTVIARTYPQLSTRRVLVMEYLDGLPLDKAGPIIGALGLQPTAVARTLLDSLLTQIMVDGVFLVDPHPGNLMLLRDGRLALLDFGSVGRLDLRMRDVLRRVLLAVEAGDAAFLADALIDVADPGDIDEAGLERALGRFMARHLVPGATADAAMFGKLIRLVTRQGVAVPAELAAVFRALATVEGTLTGLSPGFNIIAESRRFASSHLRQTLTPDALQAGATTEMLKLLPIIHRMPRRLDRLSRALEQGRFSTRSRVLADSQDRRYLTRLAADSLLTVLATATGITGAILLGHAGGPRLSADLSLYELISYSLLLAAGALALRALNSILRARD
ncbi:MAG: AarF/ABC1/UbiB kinase family protein [Actinobacteria bacterium]|nr:AarF/ABC1/UbiB kinase family protein [Actinomycetota bacterium]